jgi:hypothetical protein
MLRLNNVARAFSVIAAVLLAPWGALGQTNVIPAAPLQFRLNPEILAKPPTNLTLAAPAPALAPPTTDGERFFESFNTAARQVQQNNLDGAAVTMDLLAKSLNESPWLEIALLKYAEVSELRSSSAAVETYSLLLHRLESAPYFQGDTEHARVFRAALQGAVQQGIRRVKLGRIRDALARYHARYFAYPESLAKLSILGYIDMNDITDITDRSFRYLPTMPRFSPFITYQMYELENIAPEPFVVSAPRIEGTSMISAEPPKYAALLKVAGRTDALRVVENQTLQGYFIAAIASRGVIACSVDRVLVLPAAQ